MFAWQNAPEGHLELPGLQLQPVSASSTTIKFDLELSLQDAGDSIVGHVGYACALFDRTTIERHISRWQTMLRALVSDDQAIVARLPLLSDDEQHQLLQGFNDTAASFPAERCIHELFEDQVERTPETTALVFENTSLSYAELNAQANRLAHHLIALGVQPDTRVAIALPRGIDMVVALMATLKAGGAYVPLDLDYPTERLAYMLADSEPRVLRSAPCWARYRLASACCRSTPIDPGSRCRSPTRIRRPWASRPRTSPTSSTPRAPRGSLRGP
jgi:non-ribosomal peptide synthetase component F